MMAGKLNMKFIHRLCMFLLLGLSQGGFAVHAAVARTPLDLAFDRLESYDWGQSREALNPIEAAVASARAKPSLRRQLERRLDAALAAPVSRASKDFICRQLSLVGAAQSVPCLAALLSEPDLSHMARYALERIPDASAAAALLRALAGARGDLQIGIVDSLGKRRDARAVADLAKLLASPDPNLARAAAAALGNVSTTEAARALETFLAAAPTGLAPAIANAWEAAADQLAHAGHRREAAGIYRQLYTRPGTERVRLMAFRGLVLTEPSARAVGLLSRALADPSEVVRKTAIRLVADQVERAEVKRLGRSLLSLSATGQAAMLEALRERGEVIARGPVRAATRSSDPTVRVAALRALSVMGDTADLSELVRLAAGTRGEEGEAARFALANLPGKKVDAALISALPSAGPEAQVELLRGLAARNACGAAKPIASCLQTAGPTVRDAAIEALAVVGDEQQVPLLVELLETQGGPTRQKAQRALQAIVARAGAKSLDALLAGLDQAKPSARIILLEQLGSIGGQRALEAVRAAVASPEAEISAAAFHVLADWPDDGAAPDLLRYAQKAGNPTWRSLAFRGLVRLCRESPMPASERLQWLTQAAGVATGSEDKLLVISALADVADPEALKQLRNYLADPALTEAAGVAAIKVASSLDVKYKAQAASVLRQVVGKCSNPEVQKQARVALYWLGMKH